MTSHAQLLELERQRTLKAGERLAQAKPGEEIVISGISGSYPDSINIGVFGENLFNKKDLISDDDRRWSMQHAEIPNKGGRILEIEKFDAGFFGIHYKQAHSMDPMGRIVLEKACEAVMDAGINPAEFRGTKTGVFVGVCFSEAEKTWFYEQLQPHGHAVTGCIRSMLANRISYWLGVDGPSYTVDTACSSSLYAMEHAYRAIRTGQCDTAIVGGCNLCLHPYVTLQFSRLGVLNMDGKCKCFDAAANGYTRAEAIVVVVLQKSKDARRVYAEVIHAKTNCDGYKEEGITYPSGAMQTALLTDFYAECKVNPLDIPFVEAHGTGTKVGDPEELGAIEKIFCPKERKTPLLIGSVKSNIGHSEPASGLCSISKVVLAMEAGYLIPNINFSTPNPEIKALVEGRMKVVQEPTKWNGGMVGVSSFGFGGANCHLLIKSNPKNKVNSGLPKDDIPRLVYISGRTEEAVHSILNGVAAKPLDAEFVGLLHEVFKWDIPAHNYRGFAVFSKNGEISREVEYYTYDHKPLWYVLSGLGSQYLGMAADLMKIPVFAGVIEKCHKTLASKGVNITDLLTKSDSKSFASQINVFTAITSIQIALIEVLKYIGLKPEGIISFSIGEIAAAYIDGCLTLEESLLTSFYLGEAADKFKNTGGVVSVDAEPKKVQELLVSGLEISAINGEKNCYVSGASTKIKDFIQKLNQKNIHYEEINTTVPYHSTLVKDIASAALKNIKSVISKPRQRSQNWVSSVAHEKTVTAEYFSSILSKSINFEDSFEQVPIDSIHLEISPKGMMQKILKRSDFEDSVYIPILAENTSNCKDFMAALGKLYKEGYNPRVDYLYPKIAYPVSRGTPMMSPMIKWNHSQDWFVTKFEVLDKIKSGERNVYVKLADDDMEYIAGHMIDGRILFPATGYLHLVWETIGLVEGKVYTNIPVVFENVKFHRATNVPKDGRILLIVMVQKVSGNFEIIESGTAIVTGRVYVPEDVKKEVQELPVPFPEKKDYYVPLNADDIYQELRLRGYNYSGLFQGLHSCDTTATIGQISWKDNWVAFMDTVLQIMILQEDTRGLFVPTQIDKFVIDPSKHNKIVESLPEEGTIPAYVYKHFNTIACGGVEIRGLRVSAIGRKKILGDPVLETYKFIPNHIEKTNLSTKQAVRILLHMTMENVLNNKVKTTELVEGEITDEDKDRLLSPIIVDALADLPLKTPDATVLTNSQVKIDGVTISDKKLVTETNNMIVIASNIIQRPQLIQSALNTLIKGGFILAREKLDVNLSDLDLNKVAIFADHKLESERLILLIKLTDDKIKNYIDLTDFENRFEWLPSLQNTLKSDPSPCIYVQGDSMSGILGFVNCLRREPGFENVSFVFIMDKNGPKFNPEDEFYVKQLKKQMKMNILKNGVWGTYRHLIFEEKKEIEVEHAYVNVTVRGDLSSLRWIEGCLSKDADLDCNRVLVNVYYSALNFRDIMTATGRIAPEVVAKGRFEQECVQGLEFAGRLNNGKRILGMVPHMATATLVAADPQLCWDVPDSWSIEDAVTVPVVYGTVLYAFVVQGRIRKGMSVLIHSGTGGVGQAAINIALYYGCTVYVTVGTPEKRDFIKKNWPQIKDNQIGNSRDTSFEQLILTETNGRGVDLVLNSLAEEKLLASIRCLARGGKFLEIGKFDISKDNPLPLNMFQNENSFHGVMLDTFFTTSNSYKKIIHQLLCSHIENGSVKPIVRCVFPENDLEEMFRFMATGKHMGKVLLKIRNEEPDRFAKPSFRKVKALPRYYASKNGTFIVAGGLGGFGLELIDWLIIRGARKMVITTRRGITTGYQAMRIKTWKSYGVEIIISTDDITTYNGCQTIIEKATELGPVEGIFNLAVILQDALFPNQSIEEFENSIRPKAFATKYLDELSREMCPELKKFVIFSSVVCGRGNAGQTNYAMANSIMERICEKRHEDGLPALAVQWGAVGDVGLVTKMTNNATDVVIGGTLQQRITNCLAVLDQFLKQDEPICASMLVAEKRAGEGAASNIVDAVVNVLGIRDIKTVSNHASLAELGMDSIMAVEIKQTLEREFEVFLTPQDIRGMTFARLHEIASQKDANKENEGPAEEVKERQEELDISDMALHFVTRAIGDDVTGNKNVVILPSKATEKTKERVIMIPGIEGMATVLESLALNVQAHTIVLQPGYENKATNLQEMAELLVKEIIANTPDISKTGFRIVAYSYGTTIALEVAAILEARGYKGRMVFIDGAPAMLKLMMKSMFNIENDNDFQNGLLRVMVNFAVSKELADQLEVAFSSSPTWEMKLDNLMKYTPKDLDFNLQHYRKVINSIYMRTLALLHYKPSMTNTGKLQTKVKLIKPKQQSAKMEQEDFQLSDYLVHPVEIAYVEGNHVLIVENTDTSNEINKFLMPDTSVDKEPQIIQINNVNKESVKI